MILILLKMHNGGGAGRAKTLLTKNHCFLFGFQFTLQETIAQINKYSLRWR